MAYERFDELEGYLIALKARGVAGVGLRSVEEIRPVAEGRGITVGHTRWVTLNAYDRGTILTVRLPDVDPLALRARLEREGLTVRARSDNLG